MICTVTLQEEPVQAEILSVIRELVRFNDERAEPENFQRLAILLHDLDGSLQGGLIGYTHWRWLFVAQLWISEPYRAHGYGRRLMTGAEDEAVRRGCLHARVNTLDFQARGFYERLGYEVFAALSDYPPGHTQFFLRKSLAPTVAA